MSELKKLNGMTIGFIGLGLMGRPMCINLHEAGAKMIIHNRSREVVGELAKLGITGVKKPKEVAQKASVILLMLSDTLAVETVLNGDDGVISGLSPGSIVIDMGTTSAIATRNFAAKISNKGSQFVDAPVSGGQLGAQEGALSIMAGGEDASFKLAHPIFEILGRNITHMGPVGSGQVTKTANQVIVGITIGAVSEAIHLARQSGVDPERLRTALMGGFATSRVLELHGRRMADNNFKPGAKATTQHKDMSLAMDLAKSLDLRLPLTSHVKDLYQQLIAQGDGELDHSALIRVLEKS